LLVEQIAKLDLGRRPRGRGERSLVSFFVRRRIMAKHQRPLRDLERFPEIDFEDYGVIALSTTADLSGQELHKFS
jgi:hypothetical protein